MLVAVAALAAGIAAGYVQPTYLYTHFVTLYARRAAKTAAVCAPCDGCCGICAVRVLLS